MAAIDMPADMPDISMPDLDDEDIDQLDEITLAEMLSITPSPSYRSGTATVQ